jgi:hypothetical protein
MAQEKTKKDLTAPQIAERERKVHHSTAKKGVKKKFNIETKYTGGQWLFYKAYYTAQARDSALERLQKKTPMYRNTGVTQSYRAVDKD